MDRKELLDTLLSRVDEDKRQEAFDRLAAEETDEGKVAVLREYGVDLSSPEAVFGEGWEDAGVELTDEQIRELSGGFHWTICN